MRRLAGAGFPASLSLLFMLGLRADAVELVADLNTGAVVRPVYSNYRGIDTPRGTIFPLTDAARGMELWYTDNTPQGTRLVKDILPGWGSSGPHTFTQLGDNTVFLANDGVNGFELWRTDGTTVGTFMLANIGPGSQSFGEGYPTVVVGGVLYFAGNDGISGDELWRTDGTREGTYLLADIVPGYEGSYPGAFTAAGDNLVFRRQGELWISDGTAVGTRKIVDLNIFRCCRVVGEAVFFTASDNLHGDELWRVDIDGSNPHMVANLNTRPMGNGQDFGSDPYFMFTRGESLVFVAYVPIPQSGYNGTDCIMYRADAAGTGVTEIANFGPYCPGAHRIDLPGGSLFGTTRYDGTRDVKEMWVTDGTAAGTMPLELGMDFATASPTPVKVAYGENGEAYFFGHTPPTGPTSHPHKIWRTDGTKAGTRVFADLNTYSKTWEIAYLNGRLYFSSGVHSHPAGDELWTSDGTTAGTYMVRDINIVVDSTITDLRAANGRLQFFATGVGAGLEPWTSDGTSAGTINLISTNVGSAGNADSNPMFAGQLGTQALFSAWRGTESQGRELHITDGTRGGTALVRGVYDGGPSDPDSFVVMNDQMLFLAEDARRNPELWRTDGTSAGTYPLDVTGISGQIILGDPDSIIDGVAHFTLGTELWRTDGTAAGTIKIPGSVGLNVSIIGGNGTHLLYRARSVTSEGVTLVQLWSWDGKQARIIPAADSLKIASGPGVLSNGRVCFRAWDTSPEKFDVWCANGQAADLHQVADFGLQNVSATALHALGSKLFINATGAGGAGGLYASAGNAVTLQHVSAELIATARPLGDQHLVFLSQAGRLMLTDGTPAGTRNLLQGVTLPGTLAGSFGVLGDYVVFLVNDATRGVVVWRTDGTVAGTRYLADLDTGTAVARSDSGQFFTLGERLLFSGYRTRIGNELWSINASDPNASDDAASATGGTALAVNVLENDADFDGTLNATTVVLVTAPAQGTATVNATTGVITYTATTSYSGTDSLTYRVSDDQGRQSNVGTVSFQVMAGASPPPPATAPPTAGGGGSGGGGGALGLEIWLALALATLRAARMPRRLLRIG